MRIRRTMVLAFSAAFALLASQAQAAGGDSLVTIGSPTSPFPNNRQNEVAVAFDPAHPWVLVAGVNDAIDEGPCSAPGHDLACPFTNGVGLSGVYFSFDGGSSWSQPTYTGYSDRTGTPGVGAIGTLPGYYEHGMQSHGDPAVAFGPVPGRGGTFSWTNGSRLYYGNIALNFGGGIKSQAAIAVSRTDNVTAASVGDQGAWTAPTVVSTRLSTSRFNDKVAITADTAASSPFFGNAYVCWSDFRSTGSLPNVINVARSTDGGTSWNAPVGLTRATNTTVSSGRQFCALATDSHGRVYVFWEDTVNKQSVQEMAVSVDGGAKFSKPMIVARVTDVGGLDPFSQDLTFDGIGGTRTSSYPSVSVANGAPTGAGATNEIALSWSDAAAGLNHERALVQTSTDGGLTWSAPVNAAQSGDRPNMTSVAISPNGHDEYVTYDAFFTPWQTTTSSPRPFQGVVRHAPVSASGAIGAWTTVHRGAIGDARSTSRTALSAESVYDYNWVTATDAGVLAAWNDARNGVDCPAIDAYRQSLTTSTPLPAPDIASQCPAGFGNVDVYAGAFPP